jgi:DNA-directed RNA polymerase alpha subunit
MNEFKMSLLDYYAGLAMQGMLSNPELKDQILQQGQSWIEESAWKVAQAMIKAKETVQPLRHMHLKEFKELSNRTRNALLSEAIETYGQLVDTPALLLTKIVNLGKVGQAEIAKLLERGER